MLAQQPSPADQIEDTATADQGQQAGMRDDRGADISAQLTESQFDAASYSVGERVLATFDPALASQLKSRSSESVASPDKAA